MVAIEGKSFVVTGGLGSIGGATAALLVTKGAYAIIFDVLPQEEGEKRIAALPSSHLYCYEKTDISDKALFKASLDSALQKVPKGSLYGAVHCAAINPNKPWTNKMADKIEDFEKVIKVNALGTFVVNALVADAIGAQYPPLDNFAPRVEEERGVLINLSSVAGHDLPGRCLTYGPSKACVNGITTAAADFLSSVGIRVNSVAPALVFSALMNQGGRADYFKEEVQALSLFPRRFTQPPEIASAVFFLIENQMMNAFHLKVDAGWKLATNWAVGDPRQRCLVVE